MTDYLITSYEREQPTFRHYETQCWCKRCEISYPKGTMRCTGHGHNRKGCGMKIRNNPRTTRQRQRRDCTVKRY